MPPLDLPPFDLPRRAFAEALGTAFLVTAIVGSGIMADRLTGDAALALLCNALATGAALVVLIAVLGPLSGAHLNPAVSLVMALRGDLPARETGVYAAAQTVGGIGGAMLAHLMFGLPALAAGATMRSGAAQWLSEAVASFGLLTVILAGGKADRAKLPWLVGLYIVAAYWFTASTSFANPAVTIARAMTDTFAGIRPADAPAFIAAQAAGALLAMVTMRWLFARASLPSHGTGTAKAIEAE